VKRTPVVPADKELFTDCKDEMPDVYEVVAGRLVNASSLASSFSFGFANPTARTVAGSR
jgi:hypothetical protein